MQKILRNCIFFLFNCTDEWFKVTWKCLYSKINMRTLRPCLCTGVTYHKSQQNIWIFSSSATKYSFIFAGISSMKPIFFYVGLCLEVIQHLPYFIINQWLLPLLWGLCEVAMKKFHESLNIRCICKSLPHSSLT